VHQIDIMETMTPLDFLDFRDMLRPASGFQSMQFKQLEAKLGLTMEDRHGKEYYTSQLRPEDAATINQGEQQVSVLRLVNNWLERMPHFEQTELWETDFWQTYRFTNNKYSCSLKFVTGFIK
jgi:tryptophan 2,3-dioxygenase